jgi:bifunctional polynucleotide phosphatase/kinase
MNLDNNENYIILTSISFEYKDKLACFDLDDTIINTKTGRKFPKDKFDWKFMYPNTSEKLKLLSEDHSIIIFTNQAGIENNIMTEDDFIDKVKEIFVDLDFKLFCSKGHNIYRKPYPTFFQKFIPEKIQYTCISNESFYCGDACGRIKDFSNTDLKFALNCFLNFKTPEEVFLNETIIIPKIRYPNILLPSEIKINFTPQKPEIIVMVGCQGSGKSTISNYLNMKFDYIIISNDNKNAKYEHLIPQQSVIIDNTNPDISTRKKYIDIAKKYNINIRCIYMTTSIELSKHNNAYRFFIGEKEYIPDIVYKIYSKKFQMPTLMEGFTEVINVDPTMPNDVRYLNFF